MLKKALAIAATCAVLLGFGGMEVEAAPHPHGHAPGFHDRGHRQPPPVFRNDGRRQPPPGFRNDGRRQPPPVFRHGHKPGHQLPPGFRR